MAGKTAKRKIGPKLPTRRQHHRNLAIYYRARLERAAWKTIASDFDLSQQRCKAIVAEMEQTHTGLLDQTPTEVVEWLLMEHARDLTGYTLLLAETDHPAAVIGALNGREQTLTRVQELLQATGKLPRELGTLRHLIDFRSLVDTLLDELAEAGQMEVAERVVAVLHERGVAGLLGRGDG